MAEAVTLAHVARPLTLARSLPANRFDVVLAADPREEAVWHDPSIPIPIRPIRSIAPRQFRESLARGRPLYDADTLRSYVREDLAVIEETAPDVIVGDFRLSLAVSARVKRIPYMAITNAYWSPYSRLRFPMPDLPVTRRLGIPLARVCFRIVRPAAFALHTLPLNGVRREFGLALLGPDLRRIYTEADHTLYADVPEMVPTFNLPGNHHYLGPIFWSLPAAIPYWWDEVPRDRPTVYVNLGSSGPSELLPRILEQFTDQPVSIMAATLDRSEPRRVAENIWTAPFLPGDAAAARSTAVVCNGGSPTTHQALAAGAPIIGVASNLDQHLNMIGVERTGAGILVRSDDPRPDVVRNALSRILGDPRYASAAAGMSKTFVGYDAPTLFEGILSRLSNE